MLRESFRCSSTDTYYFQESPLAAAGFNEGSKNKLLWGFLESSCQKVLNRKTSVQPNASRREVICRSKVEASRCLKQIRVGRLEEDARIKAGRMILIEALIIATNGIRPHVQRNDPRVDRKDKRLAKDLDIQVANKGHI